MNKTHEEVLARLKELQKTKDVNDLIKDLWKVGESEEVEDLTIKFIDEEIVAYNEGSVFTQYVYEINGLLFIREDGYNSWDEGREFEEELVLVPAVEYQRIGYKAL